MAAGTLERSLRPSSNGVPENSIAAPKPALESDDSVALSPMNRRRFLADTLGLGAVAASGGCAFSLEDGLWNPCLPGPLPERLRDHPLVRAAWDGIDPAQCWDCHTHVAGVGDGGSDVWISPEMESLWHPWQNLQRRFYLNAACTTRDGHVDEDFVTRLVSSLDAFARGARAMLLAFDYFHDETGARRRDLSAFHVPDRYAADVAQRHPDRLEWVCSVHPYRADAVEALLAAARRGARAVKWLPSAMGMDPASPRCDAFYQALGRLRLPLLSHGGEELAVHGGSRAELNNPLRLRRALDHGVRVIVAHCASIGEHVDLDRGADGPRTPAFALFTRLMGDARYEGRLFGEISALTQSNRMGAPLATLLARTEWHPRLVNGSDYPLPGVIPLFALRRFVDAGYVSDADAALLSELRRSNALLFDFVLKRSLRRDGRRFAAVVFESRRVFDPRPA